MTKFLAGFTFGCFTTGSFWWRRGFLEKLSVTVTTHTGLGDTRHSHPPPPDEDGKLLGEVEWLVQGCTARGAGREGWD